MSKLITSVFLKNPILDALIKGDLVSYLVSLLLTLLSSFHVRSKYICDCKDDALHYETWDLKGQSMFYICQVFMLCI